MFIFSRTIPFDARAELSALHDQLGHAAFVKYLWRERNCRKRNRKPKWNWPDTGKTEHGFVLKTYSGFSEGGNITKITSAKGRNNGRGLPAK